MTAENPARDAQREKLVRSGTSPTPQLSSERSENKGMTKPACFADDIVATLCRAPALTERGAQHLNPFAAADDNAGSLNTVLPPLAP